MTKRVAKDLPFRGPTCPRCAELCARDAIVCSACGCRLVPDDATLERWMRVRANTLADGATDGDAHADAIVADALDTGRRYSDWFQQMCREGNDPSALRQDSPDLDEKIDSRSLPAPGGCLVWDGPKAHGHPSVSHRFEDGKTRDVNVRKYVLRRAGREIPEKRRMHVTCTIASCVNPDHIAFEAEPWTRRTSDEAVIGKLQVLALRLGHSPSTKDWKESGLTPSVYGLYLRYGGWGNVLAKAGLPPSPTTARYRPGPQFSDEELIAELRRACAVEGQVLGEKAYRRLAHRTISAGPFRRAFGSWSKALRAAGLR